MFDFIARRHGPVIWMALLNAGDWWMDTYNHEPVTFIWLPAAGFVLRWLLWCFESRACTRSGCTCCHHCCEVFKMRERHHAQIKNEIMNGVWSWRRSKQKLSFCRTFHPFIQHHDADTAHRRTLRSPDVTLLTQAGWYGQSSSEFLVAGQLCSKCHTYRPVCKM